jgi:prolyl 4-hydroxylase
MQSENSLYYYDPFDSSLETAKKALTDVQFSLYYMQLQNRAFAHQYREFTGTDWLALYKQKQPPRYHMWRADAIGQTYTVQTNEIHFVERPPDEELKRGTSVYGPRPDEIQRMRPYRDQYPELSLTLTALSCAPRVFEIKNFLSDTEVYHILAIAAATEMKQSTTRASDASEQRTDDRTRTSRNTWISRNTDMVTDAIHRRAADVMQIHESLLRWRRTTEIPEMPESMISIAERLQLVHYDVGQGERRASQSGKGVLVMVLTIACSFSPLSTFCTEYTAHHDFSMPGLVQGQPSRFATILFYLNDDMEGGETSFPRWLNAETGDALKVKPERGKAVLFYNMLPDGNYDERSQHAALPVRKGEKVRGDAHSLKVLRSYGVHLTYIILSHC